ncbi:hypothetical protein BH11ACT6_BH11ACT6_54510 [soil metagenome]
MSIELPEPLQWISYLAGGEWPQGDEDAMWRIAEYWKTSAGEMSALIPDLNRVRQETISVLVGETADVADEEFAKLFDGDYSVDKLAEAMSALGDLAFDHGTQIEYGKIQILVALGIAAAEIIFAMAMAPWTFGASLATIPLVELATMAAVRLLLSQVIKALMRATQSALTRTAVKRLMKDVPEEAVEELATSMAEDLAIQQYQIDAGHRNDFEDLDKTAIAAVAGGAAAGVLGGPLNSILGVGSSRDGKGGLETGADGGSSGGEKFHLSDHAGAFVADYFTDVAASVVGSVAVGGDLEAAGIFAGSVTGALAGGIEGAGPPPPYDGLPFNGLFSLPNGDLPLGGSTSDDPPPPYSERLPEDDLEQDGPPLSDSDHVVSDAPPPAETPPPPYSVKDPNTALSQHIYGSNYNNQPGLPAAEINSAPLSSDGAYQNNGSTSQNNGSASDVRMTAATAGNQPLIPDQSVNSNQSVTPSQNEMSNEDTTTNQTGMVGGEIDSSPSTSSPHSAMDSLVSEASSEATGSRGDGSSAAQQNQFETETAGDLTSPPPTAQPDPQAVDANSHSVLSNSDQSPVFSMGSDQHPEVTAETGNPDRSPAPTTEVDKASALFEGREQFSSEQTPTPPVAPNSETISVVSSEQPDTRSMPSTPASAGGVAPQGPGFEGAPSHSLGVVPPVRPEPVPIQVDPRSAAPTDASPKVTPEPSRDQTHFSDRSATSDVNTAATESNAPGAALSTDTADGLTLRAESQPERDVARSAMISGTATETDKDSTAVTVGVDSSTPQGIDAPAEIRKGGQDFGAVRGVAPATPMFSERFEAHDGVENGPGLLPGWGTQISYDQRRFQLGDGSWWRDFEIQMNLRAGDGVTDADLESMRERLIASVEESLNSGHRMPNGDRFNITLVFDAPHPHTTVTVHGGLDTDQTNFATRASDSVLMHEVLHYLGLKEGQVRPNSVEQPLLRRNEDPDGPMGSNVDSGSWTLSAKALAEIDRIAHHGPIHDLAHGATPAPVSTHPTRRPGRTLHAPTPAPKTQPQQAVSSATSPQHPRNTAPVVAGPSYQGQAQIQTERAVEQVDSGIDSAKTDRQGGERPDTGRGRSTEPVVGESEGGTSELPSASASASASAPEPEPEPEPDSDSEAAGVHEELVGRALSAFVEARASDRDDGREGDLEGGVTPAGKRVGFAARMGRATSTYEDVSRHDDEDFLAFMQTLAHSGSEVPVLTQLLRDLEGLSARLKVPGPQGHEAVYRVMQSHVAPIAKMAADAVRVLHDEPDQSVAQAVQKVATAGVMSVVVGAPWVYPMIEQEWAYVAGLVASNSKILPRLVGIARYPRADLRLLLNYARDSSLPWMSEMPWLLTLIPELQFLAGAQGPNPGDDLISTPESDNFGWGMMGLAIAWYLGLGYGPAAWRALQDVATADRRAVKQGELGLPSRGDLGDSDAGSDYLVREDLVGPMERINAGVALVNESMEQYIGQGGRVSENLRTQIQFVDDDVRWLGQQVTGLQGLAPDTTRRPNPDLGAKLSFLAPHLLVHFTASMAGWYLDPLSFGSAVADGSYVLSRAIAVSLDPDRSVADAKELFTNLSAEALPNVPVDVAVIFLALSGQPDFWEDPSVYPVLMSVYGLLSGTYAALAGEKMSDGMMALGSWLGSMLEASKPARSGEDTPPSESEADAFELLTLPSFSSLGLSGDFPSMPGAFPEDEHDPQQDVDNGERDGEGREPADPDPVLPTLPTMLPLSSIDRSNRLPPIPRAFPDRELITNPTDDRRQTRSIEAGLGAAVDSGRLPRGGSGGSSGLVERVRVPGDGWCLLYSVVASLAPRDWPAELRGVSGDADVEHAGVLEQLKGDGGRGSVSADSSLGRAAHSLHQMVLQWVQETPVGRWGADVVSPLRRSEVQMRHLSATAGALSRTELLEQLWNSGVETVAPADWLSLNTLREAYVGERAVELQSENPQLLDRDARVAAESEVAVESDSSGREVLADAALGMRSLVDYLGSRGVVVSLSDLGEQEVRDAFVEVMTDRPLTIAEHAGLVEALQGWQPSTAGWNSDFGEMFAPLVAHTLGVRLRNRTLDGVQDVGPTGTGRTVDVFYNGADHYDASSPVHDGVRVATSEPESEVTGGGETTVPRQERVPEALHKDAAARAHRDDGAGAGSQNFEDLERQGPPSMAQYPGTLAGMTEVARERAIDTEAIAELVNRRRHGPRALRSGRLAGSHDEALNEYTVEDVKAFMRAAGLSDQDIAKVRWTSMKSGLPYPGASLLGNILQYVGVPAINLRYGPTMAAASSAVFVLAQILSSAVLQPAVITWSEQIAKRSGPFIEVDKSKINYKVSLEQATSQADQASGRYAAVLDQLQALSVDQGLEVEHLARMSWAELKQRLSVMRLETRAQLQHVSTDVVEQESSVHSVHEQLMAARGGQQRQWEGAASQSIPRSLRSPAAAALGYLTGSRPGDGDAVGGMREQAVSGGTLVGLQGLVNMTLQGVGHVLAGVDEYNKVWLKSKLNVVYADLFNSVGRAQWARGEEVTSDSIDARRVHTLFSSPPQAVGKVVSKIVRSELDDLGATPGGERVVAELERELRLVAEGRFDQLDAMGRIARAMTDAAGGLGMELLIREAKTRYTWDELRTQVVQRFNQAAHFLVLGSAAATLLPRAVSAAKGGTSQLSSGEIGSLIASSLVMGLAGAITQYKSQTQKNYNKEMPTADSLGKQIGKGVGALYYLVTENMQSATAGERAAAVLHRGQQGVLQAEVLLDALREIEAEDNARLAALQELPFFDTDPDDASDGADRDDMPGSPGRTDRQPLVENASETDEEFFDAVSEPTDDMTSLRTDTSPIAEAMRSTDRHRPTATHDQTAPLPAAEVAPNQAYGAGLPRTSVSTVGVRPSPIGADSSVPQQDSMVDTVGAGVRARDLFQGVGVLPLSPSVLARLVDGVAPGLPQDASWADCGPLANWLVSKLYPGGLRGMHTVDDAVIDRGGVGGAQARVVAGASWARVSDSEGLLAAVGARAGSTAVVMVSRPGGAVGHVLAVHATSEGLRWVDPQRRVGDRVTSTDRYGDGGMPSEVAHAPSVWAVVIDPDGQLVEPGLWSQISSGLDALLDADLTRDFGALGDGGGGSAEGLPGSGGAPGTAGGAGPEPEEIQVRTVTSQGRFGVRFAHRSAENPGMDVFGVGTSRAGETVTVARVGDVVTVYAADGGILGKATLDEKPRYHALSERRNHQGRYRVSRSGNVKVTFTQRPGAHIFHLGSTWAGRRVQMELVEGGQVVRFSLDVSGVEVDSVPAGMVDKAMEFTLTEGRDRYPMRLARVVRVGEVGADSTDAPPKFGRQSEVVSQTAHTVWVPGDGWCMLYAVALGAPREMWIGWVGTEGQQQHSVIAELQQAGRAGVAGEGLVRAAAAVHQRVYEWVRQVGAAGIPGEVVALYRNTEDSRGDIQQWAAAMSEMQMRGVLAGAEVHRVERDWLDWVPLRELYVERRVAELRDAGGDADAARGQAHREVAIEYTAEGSWRLSDDALGVEDQFGYLSETGGVGVEDLDVEGLRRAVVDVGIAMPLSAYEYGRLVEVLQDWQPQSETWNSNLGEMFLGLVAHALRVTLRVSQRGDIGPRTGPVIALLYNGHDHYDALVIPEALGRQMDSRDQDAPVPEGAGLAADVPLRWWGDARAAELGGVDAEMTGAEFLAWWEPSPGIDVFAEGFRGGDFGAVGDGGGGSAEGLPGSGGAPDTAGGAGPEPDEIQARTVTPQGRFGVRFAHRSAENPGMDVFGVGTSRAGETVTVARVGDAVTVYAADGGILGKATLDEKPRYHALSEQLLRQGLYTVDRYGNVKVTFAHRPGADSFYLGSTWAGRRVQMELVEDGAVVRFSLDVSGVEVDSVPAGMVDKAMEFTLTEGRDRYPLRLARVVRVGEAGPA